MACLRVTFDPPDAERLQLLSNVEIEIDGVKRTFSSCARFGLAKLQDYNRSVVCVLAE